MQPVRIIGLCGHARSGKDTIGDYLRDKHNFITMSFAYPLKIITNYIINPDSTCKGLDELLNSNCVKYKKGLCLYEDFCKWKDLVREKNINIESDKTEKRFLLQTIGTEYMRKYSPNIWVDSMCYRIMHIIDPEVQLNIAITDIRFLNEADWIRSLDGTIIRVVRDNDQPHIDLSLTTHPSETELERILPDFVISAASGEIDKLYSETEKIVDYFSSRLSDPSTA